ncbi:MAG TPA: glycosyltransferase [Alphaproteobacteria bacterium]|nr:glycosyltransferase [Alphaproteobacteria bacterium]
MTRVMHVITGLSTGGAEIMLWKLLSALDERRGDIVVSLTGAGTIGPRITALGIPVIDLDMSRSPNPLAVWKLARLVRRFSPDAVQGWMYHGNLMASLGSILSSAQVPVLWNIRQSLYDLGKERLLTAVVIRAGAMLSRLPKAVVYNSKTSAVQHEALGYSAKRRIVIPNGFDCTLFHPSEEKRQRIRAEFGIADDAVLVGLVARRHPMKDHGTFIDAAALVAERAPSAHFLLIGKGMDDKAADLVERAARHGLGDRAMFLGERTDMPALTAALDIACSSSAWGEGFSNAIGEAMACGVPCVATDIGDSREIMGEGGIIIPARDPRSLANAIWQLIDIGRVGRRQIGALARRRVEAEFSLPQIARRYGEVYDLQLMRSRG